MCQLSGVIRAQIIPADFPFSGLCYVVEEELAESCALRHKDVGTVWLCFNTVGLGKV